MKKSTHHPDEMIKPLFLSIDDQAKMGDRIIQYAHDDYNKGTGHALIDAKNDAQAIASFLNEFKHRFSQGI